MLKVLTFLFSFLLCFGTLSSQINIIEPVDNFNNSSPFSLEGTGISIDGDLMYLNKNRSGIRATIDTFRRFAISNGVFRQTNESHYSFDTNFNQVFRRNLTYSSVTDQLVVASETIIVYTGDLLTSDTTYLYVANTGERIPGTRRQLLYDSNGEWYDIREDKWDINLQIWIPDSKLTLEFDGNIISRIRSMWDAGLGSYSVTRIEVWEYDSQGGNIRYDQNNLVLDSLRLTLRTLREFYANGDLREQATYTASAPAFILTPFQRIVRAYDIFERLWFLTSYVRNDGVAGEWRLSTRTLYEYNDINLVDRQYYAIWSIALDDWFINRRTDYRYNSLGNRIFTGEYSPVTGGGDEWVLDRTTEESIDTAFEPGSFVSSAEITSFPYMVIEQVTKVFPEDSPILSQHWIYKEVLPNSISEQKFYPVSIFPNPFESNITIDLRELQIPVSRIELYNSLGVLCLNKQLNQNRELQLAHLKTGIYILLLKDVNGNILSSNKMIKK